MSCCACTGSTGTRTMWAWWRMARWCLRTIPRALCSCRRGRSGIQLWITSPLSTSRRGWVVNLNKQRKAHVQVGESGVCCLLLAWFTSAFCFLNPTSPCINVSTLPHFPSLGRDEQSEGEFLEIVRCVAHDELPRDGLLHHTHREWVAVGLRRSPAGPRQYRLTWCGEGLWPHVQGMWTHTNNTSWSTPAAFFITAYEKRRYLRFFF